MTRGWIAEDLPAYRFTGDGKSGPQTDEDAAMTAPTRIAVLTDEEGARAALAGHLLLISTFNIMRFDVPQNYIDAALQIKEGANLVRIHGRMFRIVNMARCANAERMWAHNGPCGNCDPAEYTYYDTKRDAVTHEYTAVITRVKG